jgi:hypothetical protein
MSMQSALPLTASGTTRVFRARGDLIICTAFALFALTLSLCLVARGAVASGDAQATPSFEQLAFVP